MMARIDTAAHARAARLDVDIARSRWREAFERLAAAHASARRSRISASDLDAARLDVDIARSAYFGALVTDRECADWGAK